MHALLRTCGLHVSLSLSVYDRQQATSAADEVTGDTCVNLEMPLGCQKVRRKEISKAVLFCHLGIFCALKKSVYAD